MTFMKKRLLSAEDDFLSALAGGEDAMERFDRSWEVLLEEIDLAMTTATVDHATLSLAHTVSLRIAMLADMSVEVYSSCESFTTQLINQVDTMLSELAVSDEEIILPPKLPIDSVSGYSDVPASRKRRASSHSDPVDTGCPPAKKRCFEEPPSQRPHASAPKHNKSYISATTSLHPPHVTQSDREIPAVPSRKRRRSTSDADLPSTCSASKRVCRGPRVHAVSDSYSTYCGRIPGAFSARSPSPPKSPVSPRALAPDADDVELSPLIFSAPTYPPVTTPVQPAGSLLDSMDFLNLVNIDGLLQSLADPTISTAILSRPIVTSTPLTEVAPFLVSMPSPTCMPSLSYTPSPPSTPSRVLTPLRGPLDMDPHIYEAIPELTLEGVMFPMPTCLLPSTLEVTHPCDIRRDVNVPLSLDPVGSKGHTVDWQTVFDSFEPQTWTAALPPPYSSASTRSGPTKPEDVVAALDLGFFSAMEPYTSLSVDST